MIQFLDDIDYYSMSEMPIRKLSQELFVDNMIAMKNCVLEKVTHRMLTNLPLYIAYTILGPDEVLILTTLFVSRTKIK